jgi:preprotein translocase subunit YajC
VEQYLPIIVLAVLALVLFVVPARQRKRMQAQAQAMQNSLTIGTPVMTTSGLHGTVAALGDSTVDLEIAPGVVVTLARPAILEIRRPAAAGDELGPDMGPGMGRDIDGNDPGAPGATGGRPADGTL